MTKHNSHSIKMLIVTAIIAVVLTMALRSFSGAASQAEAALPQYDAIAAADSLID